MGDLALDNTAASAGTDAAGDLLLGPTGDLVVNSGQESVRQALELRLRASSGDYFMDTADGVDWIGALRSTAGYSPSLDALLKNRVLATPGVLGILDWNVAISRSTKVATVTMDVETATGVINFSLPVGSDGTA